MIRQKSRNWADCPIDDSVVDTSPPPSIHNTLTGDDDFQVLNLVFFFYKINRIFIDCS